MLKLVSSELRAWPAWWSERSTPDKALPGLLIGVYWLSLAALGGLRGDHIVLGGIVLVLCYGGQAARKLRAFAMPFLLTGVLYDSQRFYSDYLRGPIHVTEPYRFDLRYFGIHLADGRVLTPNEWWQLHTMPALDFVTGLAYLTFFAVFICVSGYFYFWVSRKGTETMPPARAREKSRRMIWSFLWLNLLGYSTYYWYAASPPWYVARYGLGPARTDVPASAAGCVRFDQLLGTHFFSEMYGRAADVHGAIPSLHVAYPLLALIFALQFKRLRVFSALFYALMCFSAVYLNHHYVLDILWGSTYAVLVAVAVDAYRERGLRTFGRAQIASVAATGVDYGLLFSLTEWGGVWYVASVAIGAAAGAVVNFLLNRHWSFEASHRRWRAQAVRYGMVSAGSLALNTGGTWAVTELGHIPYGVSVIIASVAVGTLYNYPLQRHYVFR